MPTNRKIAIVVAMEREVAALIKSWRRVEISHSGRGFKFFESGTAVLVAGGIGAEAARRATEAVISLYGPELVISAGFAGALDNTLAVGDVITPAWVINARDGGRVNTGRGAGVLVTVASTASIEQKAKLAKAYNAQAVDMEAAAVAQGAQARGVGFAALKAISDAASFELPPTDRFVTHDGKFRTVPFAIFTALRPHLWSTVISLAGNSGRASRALCSMLETFLEQQAASNQGAEPEAVGPMPDRQNDL